MNYPIKAFILSTILFLFSCNKEDCSSDVRALDTEDVTVVAGWPIRLKTDFVSATYTNQWSGQNNWTLTTKNGESEVVLANEANFSHSGTYYANSYTYDGCLTQTKTLQVHVIDPPHAPCSINTNTSSVSQPFSHQANYTQVSSSIDGNHFVIRAQNGSESLTVKFQTNGLEPKPGVQGAFVTLVSNQTPYPYYELDSDQVVYLQKNNGQWIVSFCNAVFYNNQDIETDVIVTAEIILP